MTTAVNGTIKQLQVRLPCIVHPKRCDPWTTCTGSAQQDAEEAGDKVFHDVDQLYKPLSKTMTIAPQGYYPAYFAC